MTYINWIYLLITGISIVLIIIKYWLFENYIFGLDKQYKWSGYFYTAIMVSCIILTLKAYNYTCDPLELANGVIILGIVVYHDLKDYISYKDSVRRKETRDEAHFHQNTVLKVIESNTKYFDAALLKKSNLY